MSQTKPFNDIAKILHFGIWVHSCHFPNIFLSCFRLGNACTLFHLAKSQYHTIFYIIYQIQGTVFHRKVVGSTPVGRTRSFFFRECLCHSLKKYHSQCFISFPNTKKWFEKNESSSNFMIIKITFPNPIHSSDFLAFLK